MSKTDSSKTERNADVVHTFARGRTVTLLAAMATAILGGCRDEPVARLSKANHVVDSVCPLQIVHLEIANPHGFDLTLQRIPTTGRNSELIAAWDGERSVAAKLHEGLYTLGVADAKKTWRLPIPLIPAAMAKDLTLAIDVEPHQAAPDGFRFIPGGPFLRGDELGIGQEDERPAVCIDVEPFFMAIHEVTNAEFTAFLNAGPTNAEAIDVGHFDLESRSSKITRTNSGRFDTSAPKCPVTNVSWHGADAYCRWRTEVTGRVHRLPREVEWEKAARGPRTSRFAYGNVYRTGAANQESGRLFDVGHFGVHGYGLADLTGNAFEWVADEYHADAYSTGRDRRPSAAAAPASLSVQPYRVLRGGSFILDGIYLRNSFRMRYRPTVTADDIGFRVVIDGNE